MSDLNRIMELAKCSAYLQINDHRVVYVDAVDHLAQFDDDELAPDIRAEMIRRDTVIEVWVYPRTPSGAYHVLHYDLDAALRRMVEILEAEVVTPDGIRSAPALGGTDA